MKPFSFYEQRKNQQALTTIEDLVALSGELFTRLRQMSLYKHPLAVHKGMRQTHLTNRILRAGSITYFLDIKKTRHDQPYLMITESRYQGNGGNRDKNRIIIFREKVRE